MISSQEFVSLSDYTTLHVGGDARYFLSVGSIEELKEALVFAKDRTMKPPLILGGGSNILVNDEGYEGVVIKNDIKGYGYKQATSSTVFLTVNAGENFDEIVADSVERGLWGLENLSYIPGSVGATPIQNVGAYGVEVQDLIITVTAVHKTTLKEKVFSNEECQFSYRHSFFKTQEGRNWVVVSLTYQLSIDPIPVITYKDLSYLSDEKDLTPLKIRQAVRDIRIKKFPDYKDVGTAGSFFKNPIISTEHYGRLLSKFPSIPSYVIDNKKVKIPLGYVLDEICHLKGICFGNVCLFENQALVLVALSGATATEVDEVANQIARKVFSMTNIQIEREVQSV